ncbi:MAG: MBL fold metallo-hydrolase [Kiritimatiellae bacterium]|jgi:ribonuclease BN (tRNA processing enzyme)|nr:MBL fold metallo-hydrolase [Kiritimatiellia bacterium]NLD90378.1 MBL fold metallo-hydrolase [Lentisphaerota bacterium]HOU20781.1 MBL fold metallo-hydrolase [Kiritimatiellia bacterium]HPC19466.1 MBL fold metallo-hydrolase [Kiritimatiellia bacterium]HQQ61851.1 MBL fold metallo-hydrolase [Kiritimatiellia bacterium]
MKVFLGGARGSFPVSSPDKVRYGGDTFSLLVEGRDGTQVLIDAGSGTRRLRRRLQAGGTLFFTHTHLDHLIGLPALTKAWPQRMILPRGDLEQILARVFSPPVWPVKMPPAECPVPSAPVIVGSLQVAWQPVAHPDGCVAYRVDEPATGASLVVATDVEWPEMTPRARDEFCRFARGTDLLVFDAHYLPEEYALHRGWGHSTWTDAVTAAQDCGTHKLWLMHHAPGRKDAEIDALGAAATAAFMQGIVCPAADGMTAELRENR